jgi:hypothetical protein
VPPPGHQTQQLALHRLGLGGADAAAWRDGVARDDLALGTLDGRAFSTASRSA